jgi:heme exporter protein B
MPVKATSNLSAFWSVVAAIIWKDLVAERRTWQILSVMMVFSLTAVVVFSFGLGAAGLNPNSALASDAAPGFLWATILLAGTLGLNRSLTAEQENNSLDALLMAPVDRSAIYLGKVGSASLFTLTMVALVVPAFVIFYNQPFWQPQILGIIFLATIGYVATGIMVSSMSSQARMREALLPVLLLPLSLPLVLSAATAVAAYLQPVPPAWADVQFPIAVVVAYDILMLTAGFLLYHYVVEE